MGRNGCCVHNTESVSQAIQGLCLGWLGSALWDGAIVSWEVERYTDSRYSHVFHLLVYVPPFSVLLKYEVSFGECNGRRDSWGLALPWGQRQLKVSREREAFYSVAQPRPSFPGFPIWSYKQPLPLLFRATLVQLTGTLEQTLTHCRERTSWSRKGVG